MQHYTKKFKEAYQAVMNVAKEHGEEAGRVAFRDAMLELGHEERVQNLYRVQDKLSKKAVFFVPNEPQREYLRTKEKRNVILKCRQVGFTTLNCIRAVDYALWEPNSRTGILCHKLQTVKTIFNDITKFCYNYFVRDWGHLYNPNQEKDSATALSFSEDGLGRPLNSSILVLHDFRGKTTHFLHVSEASRIESDRLVGSLNGVPANGEVTLESTAHGRAGEFYRFWQLWRAKKKLAPYKGFFVPWFAYYPEDAEKWDKVEEITWTPEEQRLMKDNSKITEAHLFWRRWCIEANCAGDEERFENEYPTNDIDCFLTGEASVFPSSILKMQERNTSDPVLVGHLISDGKRMEFHDDPKGLVSIWESPNANSTYVIGADPSGGVGRDKGAAYVKNQKTGRHVARLWGDIVPADFASELYKLAKFYNNAWICVESNNHGHLVLHCLAKELQYRNLYKRQAIDEVTRKPTKKVGFLTNNQTKILITEKLKTAAKNATLIVKDDELISEMSTFVQIAGKTGKTVRREAAANAHDDLVMAAALCEEMDSNRKAFANDPVSIHDNNDIGELIVDPDTGFAIGGGY